MKLDWGALILAAIAAMPPTLVALASLIQSIRNNAKSEERHAQTKAVVQKIQKQTDGMLITMTANAKEEGKQEEKDHPTNERGNSR